MANELEGARTLPVKFIDQGDGSTAERVVGVDIPDILVSKDLSSATASGDPNAPGTGENIVAIPYGMSVASFRWVSGTGTLQFEATFNGGTTWDSILAVRLDAVGAPAASTTTSGSTWAALLPAGATHVRMRCSVFTTGPITTRIGMTATPSAPMVSVAALPSLVLAAGTARVGFSGAPGLWQDTSTAALGVSATFTGTGRDLMGAAAGSGFGASSYGKEYRAIAVSDVVGTLNLEISRDNTTFRRIQAVAADTVNTGGLYVARLNYAPVTRYARVVYVNGAGAQTHFTLQEAYFAA